jgi:arylamine N-acetyltransferase
MAGKYTKEQVTAYFDRISLPEDQQKDDISGLEPKASLEYLKTLIRLHLLSVPFENLVSQLLYPSKVWCQ